MKTKEELTALKAEVENLRSKISELTEEELKQVTGGLVSMPNPVSGNSGEAASELGEGQDMGSWKTMSGEQFMKW